MQPEKQLEKEITTYCKLKNIDYIVNTQQRKGKGGSWTGIGATKGIPDLCVFINGRTLWIELKSNQGVMRKEQIEFMLMLLKNDIVSYTVRTLDQFKLVIEVNR